MKTVRENPQGFFEDGGWEFLQENSEANSDSEESGSDFGEHVEQIEALEEDIDSDDISSQEYSSNASENASDTEHSDVSEEGLDWDELESKARQDDERKRLRTGEDEDEEVEAPRRKKKK
eukprot:NODE_330_length_10876_cov_0.359840.p9 type:complete len:120 gc:universal NODE_330_length_10876_cov_0.359840:7702-8061(+)